MVLLDRRLLLCPLAVGAGLGAGLLEGRRPPSRRLLPAQTSADPLALAALLRHPRPDVRHSALRSLATLAQGHAAQPVMRQLAQGLEADQLAQLCQTDLGWAAHRPTHSRASEALSLMGLLELAEASPDRSSCPSGDRLAAKARGGVRASESSAELLWSEWLERETGEPLAGFQLSAKARLLSFEALRAWTREERSLPLLRRLLEAGLQERLWEEWEEGLSATRVLVLKLLSRAAADPAASRLILQGGVLQRMARQLPEAEAFAPTFRLRIAYQLLRRKILTNLVAVSLASDTVFMDGIFPLHLGEECAEGPGVDVVFVHGLGGSVFWSWRQRDRAEGVPGECGCWPRDWLPGDLSPKERRRTRVLAADYWSRVSNWMASEEGEPKAALGGLEGRAEELGRALRRAGLGGEGRRIVFVANSMGGILLKVLLCGEAGRGLLDRTSAVVFLAVPHLGSPMAWAVTGSRATRLLLLPSAEIHFLSGRDGQLRRLNEAFRRRVEARPALEVLSLSETAETHFGKRYQAVAVPPWSADPGYGDFAALPGLTHMQVSKPTARDSLVYSSILAFIRDAGRLENPPDTE